MSTKMDVVVCTTFLVNAVLPFLVGWTKHHAVVNALGWGLAAVWYVIAKLNGG